MNSSITKSYRDDKTQALYEEFKQSWPKDKCPFCERDQQLVWKGEHFKIVKNDFPYYAYDGETVTSHLLAIPLQHTLSLAELSATANRELITIISRYEAKTIIFTYVRPAVTVAQLHITTHI